MFCILFWLIMEVMLLKTFTCKKCNFKNNSHVKTKMKTPFSFSRPLRCKARPSRARRGKLRFLQLELCAQRTQVQFYYVAPWCCFHAKFVTWSKELSAAPWASSWKSSFGGFEHILCVGDQKVLLLFLVIEGRFILPHFSCWKPGVPVWLRACGRWLPSGDEGELNPGWRASLHWQQELPQPRGEDFQQEYLVLILV